MSNNIPMEKAVELCREQKQAQGSFVQPMLGLPEMNTTQHST
jgi:hypothetical protein